MCVRFSVFRLLGGFKIVDFSRILAALFGQLSSVTKHYTKNDECEVFCLDWLFSANRS